MHKVYARTNGVTITRICNGYLVHDTVGDTTYYETLSEALNCIKDPTAD